MKKILSIVLTITLALSMMLAISVNAEGISVKFNDEIMEFDVNPIIENDRTLVPFRAIFEALGCSVFYYPTDANPVVMAKKADDVLLLEIGETEMLYSGNIIKLDAAPIILNDRTLVPLRAVSEAFGAEVKWDDQTKTALVYDKKGDHKIYAKNIYDEMVAADGAKLLNMASVYPVIDNPEKDAVIEEINQLCFEFANGFLYNDEKLEETVNEIYKKLTPDGIPMELSSTYTIDTDKNGLLSITFHTSNEVGTAEYNKESIVYDLNNKKQLALTDILTGDLETEINQTVYDAFVAYYEENYPEDFNAEVAEKLGAELNNVRFYLTDNSLALYFNPEQIIENTSFAQIVEIPYSENFFKIKLDNTEKEPAASDAVAPLPATIDINKLDNCTVAVSLNKGDAYVDDNGAMQMKVTVFAYDLYDMVDVAGLDVGSSIIRQGEAVKINTIERKDTGLIVINGGLENGGFSLYTNDSTVYYECGFNDAKAYYQLGEVTLPVSTEFIYNNASDLDKDPVKYYPGDFLTDDAGIEYHFTPQNTEIVIEGGYVIEMTRHYLP